MHLLHEWTKWRPVRIRQPVIDHWTGKQIRIDEYDGQIRNCEKCGKEQSRKIR